MLTDKWYCVNPYFYPMRIYPLSEGNFSIDSTKVFIPFDGDIQNRPPGSILVQVQPFVVVTEKDIILLGCQIVKSWIAQQSEKDQSNLIALLQMPAEKIFAESKYKP